MTKVEIKDFKGAKAGDTTLPDAVYGIKPNVPVMHQVVRAQRASWRQGTHSTKNRSAVSGVGRKPFRQKGTGRARQGTSRAPQMPGGGIVFGPTPRDHSFRVNKKEIKLAMRSALSAKLADKELCIIKPFDIKKPETKKAIEFLKNHKVEDQRITIVCDPEAVNTYLSFRNLKKVNVIPVSEINTYELVDNKKLFITEDALDYIKEVLA